VHHGTREAPARVAPLEGDELSPGAPALAQLRLEEPLVPVEGDRIVLRQLAPPDTIGGGVVTDAHPRKHGRLPEVEEPQDAPVPSSHAPPAPLDDAALRFAALLREDGASPRADGELAEAAGLSTAEAAARLRSLEQEGLVVRVGPNLHFHPEPLAALVERVVAICERDGRATVAGVRDELGSSRRYAQALLEHLDAERVTRREGDAHVLRRRGAAAR
jgi:selenocysteine-specific elongation factor